jgi:hypothetical protein
VEVAPLGDLDLDKRGFALMTLTDATARRAGFVSRMQGISIWENLRERQRGNPSIMIGVMPDQGLKIAVVRAGPRHPDLAVLIRIDSCG